MDPNAENDQQLSAVLEKNADEAIPAIEQGEFAAPDLERLAELEADGKDRTTVKDAIAKVMAARANDAQGEGTNPDETDPPEPENKPSTNAAAQDAGEGEGDTDARSEGGKEARGEEVPDWKKPDYSGPLTGDQALWRNQRFGTK